MEVLARYLAKAAALERMADEENDAKLKTDLLALADAYRKNDRQYTERNTSTSQIRQSNQNYAQIGIQ